MLKRSFKNRLVFSFITLLVFHLIGCGRNAEPKSTRQMQIENTCKGILKHPDFCRITKELATKVLQDISNHTFEPNPVLLYASYIHENSREDMLLMLWMSDEEYDFDKFVVTESNLISGEVLVKEYPLLSSQPLQHVRCIIKNGSKRNTQLNLEKHQNIIEKPKVFISLPKEGQIEVEVFIIDKQGNKSNKVLLKPYIKIPYEYYTDI